MNLLLRLLLLLIVMPCTFYFIYWTGPLLLPVPSLHQVFPVIALIGSIASAWFIWISTEDVTTYNGLGSCIVRGAIIVGGTGFAAGFFGPMVFMPESNIGPIIGIFVTGPIGLIVGAMGGLIYWLVRGKTLNQN